MMPISIMLVDGLAAVRGGFRALIEAQPDMKVVREAQGNTDAVAGAKEASPSVVVTEMRGPSLDGLALAKSLKELNPATAVVILTESQGPFYFFEALRLGCCGYVPKSAEPADIVTAIRMAATGQRYVHPSAATWLVKEFVSRGNGGPNIWPGKDLTSRELQVVELVGKGLTNRQIAGQLSLSVNTVRHHRAKVMEKVGAHTTGELLRFALSEGLASV